MRVVESVTDGAGRPRLALGEAPRPPVGPDDVLIRSAASGVNRADLLQVRGAYPPPAGASPILGLEVAGVVVAVGDDVAARPDGPRLGDEVCALVQGGGYAEYVAADASLVLPVPAGICLSDAAGLPEAACTAWSNLALGGLREGATVLVQGASGGIGSMAIQIAAAAGARVIAVAGGPERVARCVELGAESGIDYRAEDVEAAAVAATGGRGVDLVLDVVGGPALAANLGCLAEGGTLVVIGLMGGASAELDLAALMNRRLTVAGSTLRGRPLDQRAQVVRETRWNVWPDLERGTIRPVTAAVVPVAEAQEAHDLLRCGHPFGKVILAW